MPRKKVQLKLEELLADNTMREWLSLVHGTDESERVTHLPAEVQHSLYWAMVYYGPAGEEIVGFFTAVEAALKTAEPDEWLRKALGGMSDSFYVGFMVNDVTLLEWSVTALPSIQDGVLGSAFTRFGTGVRGGVSIVSWLLTGQYLFSPDVATQNKAYVQQVNEVLEHLHLPALHGMLS